MSDQTPDQEPLFVENGASWWWLLGGPFSALMMVWIQRGAGVPFSPIVPGFFLILLTFVLTVQVRAARLHTSVELTRHALREGTETILISEIEKVFQEPPVKKKSDQPKEPWQSARTLGELSGIPKGRKGIGLKLTHGRTAQAWARHDEVLRAKLSELVAERENR